MAWRNAQAALSSALSGQAARGSRKRSFPAISARSDFLPDAAKAASLPPPQRAGERGHRPSRSTRVQARSDARSSPGKLHPSALPSRFMAIR